MPLITATTSRAFVRKVALPKAPARMRGATREPPVKLGETNAQSLVVGAGLIAMAENVSADVRQDLVNCTLFAQLAATQKVKDPTKVVEWYQAYFDTLTGIGWAQSDTRFEEYTAKGSSFEAHKAVIQVLSALLGPEAAVLAIVKTTLDALQSMQEDSPWITLFNRESKFTKSARFQVATAQVDDRGLLQVALVGFKLKTKSALTQVLFFKAASSSVKLKYASGKATIYEPMLASVRDEIARRLAEYSAGYVREIQLPALPAAGVRGRRRRAAR